MLQCYKNSGLLCNISGVTPLVQRTRSLWISSHHNGSDMITVHLTTANPLDSGYVLTTQISSVLKDVQVSSLCGRCNSNLMQSDNRHFPMFGVYKCLPCSSVTIALAGLMLVLLLIICNLTVSMGTIKGLIKYCLAKPH